jgi:hypothetical protein
MPIFAVASSSLFKTLVHENNRGSRRGKKNTRTCALTEELKFFTRAEEAAGACVAPAFYRVVAFYLQP